MAVPLKQRNTRHRFRHLSVSCRAQRGMRLHLLFCSSAFHYFVLHLCFISISHTRGRMSQTALHVLEFLCHHTAFYTALCKGLDPEIPGRLVFGNNGVELILNITWHRWDHTHPPPSYFQKVKSLFHFHVTGASTLHKTRKKTQGKEGDVRWFYGKCDERLD